LDRAGVSQWLKRYAQAWESYERSSIAELFSEDASYRYHPYDDPIQGREAIVDSWLEDPDDAGTYQGAYEPIAVDGDIAVAAGTSTYRPKDGSEAKVYENVFVMRFDEGGRCSEFTEWYMRRPDSAE
jgi:SnoaL-like domain